MKIMFLFGLFILGAVIGSFVCCQVWRARLREEGKKKLGKRSVCLSCGYQLRWFDNIPILSWILLKGKCRKCGEKIGWVEIVMEVGMGVVFMLYGMLHYKDLMFIGWTEWAKLFLVLVMFGIAGFLAIYDGKWGELPQKQLIMLVVFGVLVALAGGKVWSEPLNVFGAVAILAGMYYVLYKVSREQLVGSGDWILGLGFALALGDAWLAIWTLFIANAIGTVVAYPSAKKDKKKKVHFGPYFAIAFAVVMIFSEQISGILVGF